MGFYHVDDTTRRYNQVSFVNVDGSLSFVKVGDRDLQPHKFPTPLLERNIVQPGDADVWYYFHYHSATGDRLLLPLTRRVFNTMTESRQQTARLFTCRRFGRTSSTSVILGTQCAPRSMSIQPVLSPSNSRYYYVCFCACYSCLVHSIATSTIISICAPSWITHSFVQVADNDDSQTGGHRKSTIKPVCS